jgi:hypothetical protein
VYPGLLVPTLAWLTLATGCTGDFGGNSSAARSADAGPINTPLGFDDGGASDKGIKPNYDAFFANDPPAKYCGPDGGWKPPPLPGGTPECPSDKNREGCPCNKQGEKATCWPGQRKHRGRGICKDGETVCTLTGEHQLRWGPCKGYVLPKPGATKGPDACRCFSSGQWQIDNLAPCFVNYQNTGQLYAVSTYLDATGQARCPQPSATPPPKPKAGEPWSKNTLKVDCAGQFKLCYTIKAGDPQNPSASDCVLARACTSAWYPQKDVAQPLPPLPGWSSNDPNCAATFDKVGGYGEMSVLGQSIECDPIDDGGKPLVFHQVTYCPLACNKNPTLPGCQSCANGANGSF